MCGISGELRFDGESASVEAVARMSRALAPRGPGGSGVFAQGRFAFAHRRLEVIDPSPRAQQPMFDSELRLGIVYNGAVYNYRQLRRELEGRGYRFFSRSDTEVLLKAYHAWGKRFVERLDGMFAFALWHADSGRVLLGRDRLGIKPLYTAQVPGLLRFASSLPALLAAGGADTGIDPVALHHYLSLNAAVPAPRTILRGVRKLPPATLLEIEADGTTEASCYWQLRFPPVGDRAPGDEASLREEVLAALRRAVRRRLAADVPVGALLSGGLDSSLVVGLMAELGERVKTCSIGFHRVGAIRGNEFHYSDLVAELFGTEHRKLLVGPLEILRHIEGCVGAMSEPQVSRDAIGFYLLAREVGRELRVVQTGQGADEIFAGYAWHQSPAADGDPAAAYLRAAFDCDHARTRAAMHPRFAGADHTGRVIGELFEASGSEEPLERILHYETAVHLSEDPLKRVDNMTMAWGLEARVPFLDHRLVELAARIPSPLKGGGKYILKQAARSILPEEVVDRRKGYFPVPALQALRGSALAFVRRVLTRPRARQRALFCEGYVDELLAAPAGRRDSRRLWQAAILEYWLQVHGL